MTIDLADLVSILSTLKAPNREVDYLVEAMLGHGVRSTITERDQRMGAWLQLQVPHYTEDLPSVLRLACSLGAKVEVRAENNGYLATAEIAKTSSSATAYLATTAALSATISTQITKINNG